MTIAVVSDSTADIPPQLSEKLGINIVHAFVRFGDEELRDGVDISTEDFYTRLASDKSVFPTTSQPAPGDFKTVYDSLLEEHDEIVSVHISSKVSGTYASAVAGAAQSDPGGERIKHVDTLTASMGTGWVAIAASKAISDGASFTDAVSAARNLVPRVQFGGAVDTLEYLKRGGRLKGAQALMANILNIRPVLSIVDGEVEVLAKPRSHRRAMSKLIDALVEEHAPLSNLAVMYTDDASHAEADATLQDLKHHVDSEGMAITSTLGPAIGSHLGNGTVAIAVSW